MGEGLKGCAGGKRKDGRSAGEEELGDKLRKRSGKGGVITG